MGLVGSYCLLSNRSRHWDHVNPLVGSHTTAAGIAPDRLHGIEVRTKRDVGRIARPCTQVAIFLATRASAGDPAKVRCRPLRMWVRHGFGILVATDNGKAIEIAIAIAVVRRVDEVLTAVRASIRDVGHIGIGHIRP